MENNALLFIPDISGFTDFVADTDVVHSGHIISELLENIIDNDNLGFEVSEIEGDAILFYRFGKPPTLDEVVEQCKRMFVHFHQYLKTFERDRICECGACSTANRLTLKMFVHFGTVGRVKVKEFQKLHGESLIVVHRLMKNTVRSHEYVLLTNDYLASTDQHITTDNDWFDLIDGIADYGEIGQVEYKYSELLSLHELVVDPPSRVDALKIADPISTTIIVNATIRSAHRFIANIQNKLKLGAKQVILKTDKIPRVGTEHACVLPAGALNFRTTENKIENGRIEFAETVQNMPMIDTASMVYLLTSEDEKTTRIVLSLHHRPIGFRAKMKYGVAKYFLPASLKRTLRSLKTEVEKE